MKLDYKKLKELVILQHWDSLKIEVRLEAYLSKESAHRMKELNKLPLFPRITLILFCFCKSKAHCILQRHHVSLKYTTCVLNVQRAFDF